MTPVLQATRIVEEGSTRENSDQDEPLRGMGLLAIIGQCLLLLSAGLLPVFSEFHLVDENIGELANGEFGLTQTFAFLIAGTTAIVFAFALRQATLGTRGSLAGSMMIGVYGLAGVAAALFPMDIMNGPIEVAALSSNGLIHLLAASIGVVSMTAAMFVLTMTFARDWRWKSITVWSVLLSASALSLLFAQSQGPIVGLMQRALVTIIAAWVIMAAVHLRRVAEMLDIRSIRSMASSRK